MTKMNGKATVAEKFAFGRIPHRHGITIFCYHADNGLFDTKVFCAAIGKAKQTLTFCEASAHHQNGLTERRIQNITVGTRTSLPYASHS